MFKNLIEYIKFSLAIGVGNVTDPSLEEISDGQLEMLIKQHCKSLGIDIYNIEKEDEAFIICLVRKDVYWRMATLNAPLYELQMDGLKVSKQTRFEHYFKLIQEVEKEYLSIKNDPNRVKVRAVDVYINRAYNLRKQFNNYEVPDIEIEVDEILENGYNISIDIDRVKPQDYVGTKVYFSNRPIIDRYNNNSISEQARLVFNTRNIHTRMLRVTYEDVNRTNYLLLVVELKNGLKAYHELEVTPNE